MTMRGLIGCTLLAALPVLAAPLEYFHYPATAAAPLLPESVLTQPVGAEGIRVVAARGEYEPVSWAVRSTQPVAELMFELSPLTGAAGTLPESAVDLRWVLCWYQSGTAWQAIEQKKGERILVPELLLHDPGLVTVDSAARKNFLRVGDGQYRDINDDTDNELFWQLSYPVPQNQTFDTAELQPSMLPADFNRQLWLTVHVPEDTAPGEYRGTIRAWADGEVDREIPLTVTVLPFALAAPAVNYDAGKPFTSSLYQLTLVREPGYPGDLSNYHRNPEQFAAELRNLKAHGITNPLINQLLAAPLEQLKPTFMHMLELRKQAGMDNDPLYILTSPSFYFGDEFGKIDLEQMRQKAETIAGWVEESLGHRNVWFYGFDEAKGEDLSMQKEAWKLLHALGFRVFASGYTAETAPPGNFAVVGDELDLLICAMEPARSEAAKWHSKDHLIWNYANPQAGVENPAVYRHNYGLVLYLANYDGAADFCYYHAFGDPWNDFDSPHWRDHNFVYPTADGVIDTIAWEGYREGIDDIRYATTLRLAIRDAVDRQTAAAAEAWLNALRVTSESDLDAIRTAMIDWILKLQ